MARDTEQSFADAGFELHDVARFQIFAPGLPAFPFRRFRATRPRR